MPVIELIRTTKCDPVLLETMPRHYSNPAGFVGRSLIYRVMCGGAQYGFTVAGSCSKHLPRREEFFGHTSLESIINNTFFHIEPGADGYPVRNFAQKVVALWRERCVEDWQLIYGDRVIGLETLVEPPRSGELYRRDGWQNIGMTKGNTCKRLAGKGTDCWGGKRVWDRVNLRPKHVFYRKVN